MKKNTIYRYFSIAACLIIVSASSVLGAKNPGDKSDKNGNDAVHSPYPLLQVNTPVNTGIPAKTYYAALADNKNNKWFLTELGIISFSAGKWTLHNENSKIGTENLKDFSLRNNPEGYEFWIASQKGAIVTKLPFDSQTEATTYLAENASILSNNVFRVVAGNGPVRWVGTDKGVSALNNNKWLTPSYDDTYPEMMFTEYPINAMATNPAGDSLYVGTNGAGVARVFRNDVDGISGASVYAQWGPIILPSDKICSIFIAPDGTKWFGTDLGVASHKGNNTLENWTVYTTAEGLVNNYVQAITADNKGNMWFGTKGGGISVFNGTKWTSYTTANGLSSDNILCLMVDNDGIVWAGTDNGVSSICDGKIVAYK
jgi:ligand-binding sensor domain-containing protein